MYDQSKHSELIPFDSAAIADGLPAPVIGSALAHSDDLREKRSPANLIQGLRDEFGAHGCRPFDRDGKCHTDWCQTGTHPQ
jgi:6-phosphogluconate dehydrogenase